MGRVLYFHTDLNAGRDQNDKFYLLFSVLLACIMFGQAALGATMFFSTGGEHNTSWTITVSNQVAVLSFMNNEVDATIPFPDALLDDLVDLPDMTLTNLQATTISGFDIISATLVPDGSPLTVRADIASGPAAADQIVLSANIIQGGYLTVGSNFIAYSTVQDDLFNLSHLAGYSDVIDTFAAADAAGLEVDLSFSGDTSETLLNMLNTLSDGAVSGTLSGQITAVPEPGMIAMLSLGAAIFLLRRKL